MLICMVGRMELEVGRLLGTLYSTLLGSGVCMACMLILIVVNESDILVLSL